MKQLILGGARSGKSHLAEMRAESSGKRVIYVATAQAWDEEMAERIRRHREQRPDHWQLIEEPVSLADVLQAHASADTCVLVDCLTLWVTNLLLAEPGELERELDAFYKVLADLPGEVILVSNEVGWGIVPMGELSRQFQDQAGWLHQRLGEICERVTLTVAGIPMEIKQPS
ncbi:bifunctional adenosylcobinamide kinase/adenosylcobinamide-phosphate guanylyltransferase [Pontibacterium granulatum]|uniref:bifunctional adenosylcobinamide kinase/adenosylcobinamide-phosphate guanylyltransferase n=1 Tax=Pontibacterium granulatum TaxID=2036029 RepID=UPI00249A47AD|nr:bifunctional adenosylcobinamide kinase/adenosylcobinamide-phosphate guanylyltransferase [Pontibacterium granulatum]MDI3323225.1 bifunctional adenosylcobinamide kinase/adenosylcobinamide-phosphate guanylyltransferase [Pontibacterium granulatum]